jgi:hypothetical protein
VNVDVVVRLQVPAPASVASAFVVTTDVTVAFVPLSVPDSWFELPDCSRYSVPLSFDISSVKSHGFAAPMPDPQVLDLSVPTTLKVPSEVPGSDEEFVHLVTERQHASTDIDR